jgi:tetratricopeptide (TPR) repeat protein
MYAHKLGETLYEYGKYKEAIEYCKKAYKII